MDLIQTTNIEMNNDRTISNTPMHIVKESYRDLGTISVMTGSGVSVVAPKHWFIDEYDMANYIKESKDDLNKVIDIIKQNSVCHITYAHKLANAVGGYRRLYEEFILEYFRKLNENPIVEMSDMERAIGSYIINIDYNIRMIRQIEAIRDANLKPSEFSNEYLSTGVYHDFSLVSVNPRILNPVAMNELGITSNVEEFIEYIVNNHQNILIGNVSESETFREIADILFTDVLDVYNFSFDRDTDEICNEYLEYPYNDSFSKFIEMMEIAKSWVK